METEIQDRKVETVSPEDGTVRRAAVPHHTFRLVAKQADMEALDAGLNAIYDTLNQANVEHAFSYSFEKHGDEVFYEFVAIPDQHATLFRDMLGPFSQAQAKADGQTLKEAWYAKQEALRLVDKNG